MLLWAASFGLALLSDQQLPKKDALVWESAKHSVAVILRAGAPCGQAALIDKSGLFLANQSTVTTPTMQAKLSDGRVITLTWKAVDVPTQAVLLQAEDWNPEDGTVVTLHQPGDKLAKAPVLVVLPSGPVRGELISDNRVAVLSASRRMFPLGEVRFEASTQSVAGALVFDEHGHLVGLLNATLESESPEKKLVRVKTNGNINQTQFAAPNTALKQPFGPADFTTGYTVGPEVLRRVVSGFLSPNRKVQHPAIGVNCKDAPTPGALILTVRADSPAAKAGIQPGDIIIKMDERVIKDQFDFARVIESKDSGDPLTVTVMRDSSPLTFKLTVGTMPKAQTPPTPTPANGDGSDSVEH